MTEQSQKITGIVRIKKALSYSITGLKITFKSEAAFRQELALFVILLVALWFLPFSIAIKMLLLFANCLVLITELLNSAIEEVVDLISPDYHELAKNTKDIASSAVFVSLAITCILWIMAILTII